ncbi:VPLPA-CTERM sorting domain-containing protein [Silicimonas sp. MF1-12-2]|uniref:VPLPA-CTERM sorting domain-containing protein n=1 Tax=Silicimonas sp. MF1-12-2 TaxID=3384793 RepID=UPI0039B5EC49
MTSTETTPATTSHRRAPLRTRVLPWAGQLDGPLQGLFRSLAPEAGEQGRSSLQFIGSVHLEGWGPKIKIRFQASSDHPQAEAWPKGKLYARRSPRYPSRVLHPAAGWMLIAGVGGLAAMKRRARIRACSATAAWKSGGACAVLSRAVFRRPRGPHLSAPASRAPRRASLRQGPDLRSKSARF